MVVLGQLGANGDDMQDGVALANTVWAALVAGSDNVRSGDSSSSGSGSGDMGIDGLRSHPVAGPVSWANRMNYFAHRNDEVYF